jgi:hypothetical protein
MNINLSEEIVQALVKYAKLGLATPNGGQDLDADEKNSFIHTNAEKSRAEGHVFLAEKELYKLSLSRRERHDSEDFSESKTNWIERRR